MNAQGKAVKLVSARRWAADEDGNRMDGAPTVKNGDVYKFVNSHGDVVWFNSATSRHIYGEAIDVINGKDTEFKDVLKAVMDDAHILSHMFSNGIYCAVEQTRDDTNNTIRHYHFGTVDKESQQTSINQSTWWADVMRYTGTDILRDGGKVYKLNAYLSV